MSRNVTTVINAIAQSKEPHERNASRYPVLTAA
jgi:hypothetical protein